MKCRNACRGVVERTPIAASLLGKAFQGAVWGWVFAFCLLGEAAFDDAFGGARLLGMGGVGVALVNDTDAIAVNPAGLALLGTTKTTNELSASYANLFLGLDDARISQSYVAFAQSHPERGGIGVAWKHLGADVLYSENRLALGVGRRTRLGKGEAHRKRLALGVRVELLKWDSAPTVGVSGNILEDLEGPTRFAAAAGALVALSPRVFFGAMFHHLNEPDVASKTSERRPRQVVLGLGARGERFLWGFDILLERQQVDVRTGLEWEAIPKMLSVRGGFRLEGLGLGNNVTLGSSLHPGGGATRLDYAVWMPIGTIRETHGSHRIGVVYVF